jgi:hypothetical protein
MAQNPSGKFRRKRVNFAQISNSALHDKNLSLKAKGLYSVIQSIITLPDEDMRIWKIRNKCKEGNNGFEAAWKELKDCGYLKQYRMPGTKKGQFDYIYDLLDQPDLSTPATINLNKQGKAKQELANDDSDHTPPSGVYGTGDSSESIDDNFDHTPPSGYDGENQVTESDHTPHFAPYGQSTGCSEHPMLNGGDNNNTDMNNTNKNNIKSISQSDDRRTDEIRKELQEQIEYDYFLDNYPDDISGIDAVVECMVDMLSRRSTKIKGVVQSREALKTYIDKVDSCTIREFLEHMRSKDLSGIKNMNAYWQSALINYLREQDLRLTQIK